MSTEKIREALGAPLAESARALYRAAMAEVEAVERAHHLALDQIDNMRANYKSRAVLDHADVIGDLWRLRRIITNVPRGHS